jgi:hypothetical protein
VEYTVGAGLVDNSVLKQDLYAKPAPTLVDNSVLKQDLYAKPAPTLETST